MEIKRKEKKMITNTIIISREHEVKAIRPHEFIFKPAKRANEENIK